MVVLLLVLFASSAGTAASETGPCRASLPKGPAVPAPVILRTTCGGFRLARNGTISRLPPRWFDTRAGGTGRRYGADLRIQRTRPGRIVLSRHGRVVWRSRNLYHRDGGDLAFGPGAFAFASYRRGIFVTDLKRSERLIVPGVGLYPLAFLRDGSLLVTQMGSVSVVSPDGTVLRRYRYRPRNGYAFDQRTESLFFVTRERVLFRAQGTSIRAVRPLNELEGWIYLAEHELLVLQDNHAVAVIRRDGTLVARAGWQDSADWALDSGIFASSDGSTFAFRLTNRARAGPTDGTAVVYLLHAGEDRAHGVYRHRLGESGCAVGASLTWHGGSVLYSSTDGHLAVLDARRGGVRSLAELAAALPRRVPGESATAYWASDFSPPATRSR